MTELKPCPFCGGEAHMITRVQAGVPSGDDGYTTVIKCLNHAECGAVICRWALKKSGLSKVQLRRGTGEWKLMYNELIDALRKCGNEPYDITKPCKVSPWKLMRDAADAIEELISRVHKWISVKDRVPEQTGLYNVYLQEATSWLEQGMEASYVTTMWFDKKQMLWVDGDDSYNAVLSAVNTNEIHHVTHWCELPEPPKGK